MGKTSSALVVGGVLLLVVLGIVALVIYVSQSGVLNNATGGSSNNPSVSAQGCNIAPSFSYTGVDGIVATANATPSNYDFLVNGVYKGVSYTPSFGDKVQVLSNPSGYLADVQSLTVGCGVNQVPFKFYKHGNATISVKSDSGVLVLTNSLTAGINNESTMTTTKNNEIDLVAPAQVSTGKMFVVVEMPGASAPNISSMQLGCAGLSVNSASSIPSYISTSNTNSFRGAWEVSPIQDGQKAVCNLQTTPLASTSTTGVVRMTIYYEDQFVDSDGAVKTGTYTQLGTAKWQDKNTYSWTIGTL